MAALPTPRAFALLLTTSSLLAASAIASPLLAQRGGRGGDAPAEPTPAVTRLPKGPRAMMLADWYRVVNVSAPAMSPDGKRVAMTVTRAVEGENRRHNEIWVVNTAGGEPQRWTSPATESSNPRWSHDGKYLFFTSQRTGGRGSTWAVRLDEPAGEAIQVDGYPDGSMPANHAFAVSAGPARETPAARNAADPFARMQPMAKAAFDAITRPAEPARFDGRHVVDMSYKVNGVGFVPGRATARTWRPQQLWKQSMGDTARAEPLYLEAKAICEKVLGKEHPTYATSLNNLATLYQSMGDTARAEPLYLEAKAICEKVLGKEHPNYATSLNNLATLYQSMGDTARSEPLYLESKALCGKVMGKENTNDDTSEKK